MNAESEQQVKREQALAEQSDGPEIQEGVEQHQHVDEQFLVRPGVVLERVVKLMADGQEQEQKRRQRGRVKDDEPGQAQQQ